MGVDTKLTLPASVNIQDVATATAILLGMPKTWTAILDCNQTKENLSEPTTSGWVSVKGISFKSSDNMPACCTIAIEGIGSQWWLFYHFEFGGGQRGMIGGSRAERIALHRGLVDIFGGRIDYDDCDSKDIDYKKPSPRWLKSRNSDEDFHKLQLALWNLKPISKLQIKACEQWASYKDSAR